MQNGAIDTAVSVGDLSRRRFLVGSIAGASLFAASGKLSIAAVGKDSLSLAMIGEPQVLDPMLATSDLVGTVMQHVFETLYTFDAKWNVVPLLANAMPDTQNEGKTVTIPLRQNVQFHNGQPVTVDDVLASLERWMKMAAAGKAVARLLDKLSAPDAGHIRFDLKEAYAPLLAQMALISNMAAIMPKTVLKDQLDQFVGTGPYKFIERKPDQYVRMERFDGYTTGTEAHDGYGGKRQALVKELRFIPVPDANTRVEGALSGQFDFADLLPVEAAERLEKAGDRIKPIITENFGFPYIVFNTKEGVLKNVGMRQALQAAIGNEELLLASFGDPRFFRAEGNFFPEGTPFYSRAGVDNYNQNNPEKAAKLMQEAKYDGAPIRIMASRQYEFHYNIAQVLVEQLGRAGIKADLQVVDWATLVQRRNDPKVWDLYITHSGLLPEPMMSPPQLGDSAPGWWTTPEKTAMLKQFNTETDAAKRGQLWGKVQELVYHQVPYVIVGKFNALSCRSSKLEGYQPATWPYFWNTK